MPRKGSCCCTDCFVHDGCGPTGAAIDHFCCKCIPRRVCVSLFTDQNACEVSGWDADTAVDSVEASWFVNGLCVREYAGSLSCGSNSIDFSITFYRDPYTDVCSLCLESVALGYVLDGDDDSRVCIEMGGGYNDTDTKRAECVAMSFEFPIDLTPLFPYGTGYETGTITIEPGEYVQAIARDPETSCRYDRVCITVVENDVETIAYACFDEGVNGWTIDVDDDPAKNVLIVLDSYDAATESVVLSLTSYLGSGSPQNADCPSMYAIWNFGDDSISIRGDRQAKCTDCKCYCRCLCVTYTSDDGIEVGRACLDTGYDGCEEGWSITLAGKSLNFYLACTGCENLATVIGFNPPAGSTLITTQEQSVSCPDGLDAQWTIDLGGGETATILVECSPCSGLCVTQEACVECCPDNCVPLVLYGTVESSVDCPELQGQVFTLINSGATSAPSNCWDGEYDTGACVTELAIACLAQPAPATGNAWYGSVSASGCAAIDNSDTEFTLISCDPLELLGTIVGVGCCTGGIAAEITVRVTE